MARTRIPLALVCAALLSPGSVLADAPAKGLYGLPALDRDSFNRMAVQAALPLFWQTDEQNPGVLDASELVDLSTGGGKSKFKRAGKLTKAFEGLYRKLVEARRQSALARELDQGRVTLVQTDFSKLTDEDRRVMKHLERAGNGIDDLYQQQTGTLGLRDKIPFKDTRSRAVFQRNQSPGCVGPLTTRDPFCSALPDFYPPRSFAYPHDVEVDKAFCETLGKHPRAKELLDPFTVVRREGGKLVPVPYSKVYGKGMKRVAKALRGAAGEIKSGHEAPFKAYLLAAAKGFETNSWWEADWAWSKMGGTSSRWYLRIAPDETYFDPCQVKSGFHMSLARVDRSALKLQQRLTELRTEMEQTIAQTIGEPYKARKVQFHLPEFVEIIRNAGDSRSALGATIGQSLPNFGPVAAQSRGRTVAMANLYTDPASRIIARKRAASLFTKKTMTHWTDDPSAARMDTVLHEATHNFGPTGSWLVDGKKPEEIFGGRYDAILEELKAQTGALYFLEYLRKKGDLTDDQVAHAYTGSIAWAFGHISRGMFTASGKPRTYSQLAAIQVRALMTAGAITFVAGGDGPDPGRFEIHMDKMAPAIDTLMAQVGKIKAAGDVAAAKALIESSVTPAALRALHADLITERVLRYPKASFAYRVKYR